MKKVLKIDNEGYFLEDVILDDNEIIPNNCVDLECGGGFYRPKFQGGHWIEGLNQDEVIAIQKQSQISVIKAELDLLDIVLPRATEDLINALDMDISKLPQIMQDRLNRKIELRQQLKTMS